MEPVVVEDIETRQGVSWASYNPSSASYSFSAGRQEGRLAGIEEGRHGVGGDRDRVGTSSPSSSQRQSLIKESSSSDINEGTINDFQNNNDIENKFRISEWLCVELRIPEEYRWHAKPNVKRLFACIARFKPIPFGNIIYCICLYLNKCLFR